MLPSLSLTFLIPLRLAVLLMVAGSDERGLVILRTDGLDRAKAWPKIFILELPEKPFRTCNSLQYYNLTSNYAAEVGSRLTSLCRCAAVVQIKMK